MSALQRRLPDPRGAEQTPPTLSSVCERALLLHLASFPGRREVIYWVERRARGGVGPAAVVVVPAPGRCQRSVRGVRPATGAAATGGAAPSPPADRSWPPGWPFKRQCLVRGGGRGALTATRGPAPPLSRRLPPSVRPSLGPRVARSLAGRTLRLRQSARRSSARRGAGARGRGRGLGDPRPPPGKAEPQWLRWAARG